MALNNLNFDRAVYYLVTDALNGAGIPASSVRINDGDIIDSLFQQAEEGSIDLETFDEASVLPAISIIDEGIDYSPGALGGATWANHAYTVFVYGNSSTFSKLMAEAITQKLKEKIDVYDYTISAPGDPNFPASGHLLGSFPVRNIRNIRPGLPSLSLLDSVRRDISFEIVPLEK